MMSDLRMGAHDLSDDYDNNNEFIHQAISL